MAHDLFHMGIPVLEKAIRTAAVYGTILLLLRVAGKRSLASFNSFDLVVLLLLSNVVQNAVIGPDDSLLGGVLGAVMLLFLNWGLVRLSYMHPLTGRILQGTPTTLYEDARVLDGNLRHELITREELVVALRHQGMGLEDVTRVAIEPDGVLNATPKTPEKIDQVLAALRRIEQRLG
jgi:uncharacterized membrane protein YcaP (DUF421 family)